MSFDLRRQKQPILGQSTELIGELLLKAGVIKQHQLDEALKLAGNKHMQIGQMLIMARYINQNDLQAAIDAQTALRDRILDMNTALKALSSAHRNNTTFAEASQKQSQETALVPSHKLGQLLLDANLIGPEQLSVAVQKSMATGLPVGRILILNNVITEPILAAALEVLIKMRDSNVGRDEALAYLSELIKSKATEGLGVASLEEASLFNSQPVLSTKKSMRLGEFLVLANILSETDVMNALEFSLVAEKRLGESLLEHGYITFEIIDSALKLQSLVESDTLDCQKAAQCLNIIHVESINLTEALEKVNSAIPDGSQLEFTVLLIESGLINETDIKTALQMAASSPRILSQILNQTGYLSSKQTDILIECHEAITQNIITQHDAKYVLDFCLQKLASAPITFVEGLKELGWSKTDEPDAAVAAPPSAQPPPAAAQNKQTPKPKSPSETSQSKLPSESTTNQGSFLGSTVSANANQSFIGGGNNSPAVAPTPTSTPIPAAASTSTSTSTPPPAPPEEKKHTGKTTSNMPAITSLQIGSELHPTLPTKTAADKSDQDFTEDAAPPSNKPAQKTGKGATQTCSLKALLQEENSKPVQEENQNLDQEEKSDLTEVAIVSQDDNETPKPEAALNGTKEKKSDEELELSDSEKALIMKASSLTASPQEIMAAMKLAARKEKTIQGQTAIKDESLENQTK